MRKRGRNPLKSADKMRPTHIGLIVGIGAAATDCCYRHLISALARVGQGLTRTMVHADLPTLLRHQAEGNTNAHAEVYRQLTDRLQRSGVDVVAVTSVAGQGAGDRRRDAAWRESIRTGLR